MRRATNKDYPPIDRLIFQSTLSMRRATVRRGRGKRGDLFQSTLSMRRATFPYGAVLHQFYISIHALHEESDPFLDNILLCVLISIHALHEESDFVVNYGRPRPRNFNPRSP